MRTAKEWDFSDLKTETEAEEKLREGSSVVIGSITSCDSVRHDAVAELHKAER